MFFSTELVVINKAKEKEKNEKRKIKLVCFQNSLINHVR